MMKRVDQMVRIRALGLCVGWVWRAKIEQRCGRLSSFVRVCGVARYSSDPFDPDR